MGTYLCSLCSVFCFQKKWYSTFKKKFSHGNISSNCIKMMKIKNHICISGTQNDSLESDEINVCKYNWNHKVVQGKLQIAPERRKQQKESMGSLTEHSKT